MNNQAVIASPRHLLRSDNILALIHQFCYVGLSLPCSGCDGAAHTSGFMGPPMCSRYKYKESRNKLSKARIF